MLTASELLPFYDVQPMPKLSPLEQRLTPEDFRIVNRSMQAAYEFQQMNLSAETDSRRMQPGMNTFWTSFFVDAYKKVEK